MIDVCICTHNPRRDLLLIVINSLVQQSAGARVFRVIIVDNASYPKLNEDVLAPFSRAGIEARIIYEPIAGLQRARLRCVEETIGDWVLWVDDDNELSPDYIEESFDFIRQHPEVGCFGGKLLLPDNLTPKSWVLPFLPYLGIKDAGNSVIIQKLDAWGDWEPAGAGSWVHRKVLNEYSRRASDGDEFFRLGRSGSSNLASCDDSMLMRGAFRVDMACAYVPQLKLNHHLNPNRFNFKYLMRIMQAYGSSHVVLESILRGYQPVPSYYRNMVVLLKTLLWVFLTERKKSLAFAVGKIAYHIGARREHFLQESNHG